MNRVEVVDATPENVCTFGFCGFKNPAHGGHRRKVDWLKRRFAEGMRFKVLQAPDDGSVGFIEYMPGTHAWRPVDAPGYFVIHCVMIYNKKYKEQGFGSMLLTRCLEDAQQSDASGVAVVTSKGTWMAGPELFTLHGFVCVDSAPPSFELLARKCNEDAPDPKFKSGWDEQLKSYGPGIVILRSDQCPCVDKAVREILDMCQDLDLPAQVVELENAEQAQAVPSAYGVFNVIYDGLLVADHPISKTRFRNILKTHGVT